MSSYELRTFKDGRWMTEERSQDREAVIEAARERVGSKQYQQIHVVEDVYDESIGAYREKVIFRHGSGGNEGGSSGKGERGGSGSAPGGDPYGGGGRRYGGGADFDIPELEEPQRKSFWDFFK